MSSDRAMHIYIYYEIFKNRRLPFQNIDDNFNTDRKKFNKFKNSVASSKAEKELKYRKEKEEEQKKEAEMMRKSEANLDEDEEKAEPGEIPNFWCQICYR